jgi:signal transduction histidine kinase
MSSAGRLWLAALVAGPFATAGAATLVVVSNHEQHVVVQLVSGLFVAISFLLSGLVAWWRRPENATGRLLVLVAYTFLASSLAEANGRWLYTLGMAVGALSVAALVQLVLAYPTGTLRTRFDRGLVAAGYAVAFLGSVASLLFDANPGGPDCRGRCPENVLLVTANGTAADAIDVVVAVLAFAIVAVLIARLARRWGRASAAYRRSLRPVLLTGGATFACFCVQFATMPFSHRVGEVFNVAAGIAFLTVPVAFLYGLAQESLGKAAVARLALDLQRYGPGRLGEALREVLHDPSLTIAYRLPDGGYATVDGSRVTLPPPEWPGLTPIEPIAAVIHDPALRAQSSQLLDAALATARLSLENERLQAELAAKLQELRAAHTRGLDAVIAERRRLERNLHDGAQQRLVALALTLRMAQSRLGDEAAARTLLDEASAELAQALEELRELARGIHPAVLSERGLGAAVESLAQRSRLPIQVERLPEERLPHTVEIAAYYVIAEALTNVAKYAAAERVVVAVEREDGLARIEVRDDGAGGADLDRGSGLRGLADRLALVGGRLDVSSPPGAGTCVSAEIPVA